MTSRELVKKTVEFTNNTDIVPRDLWTLPWAELHYPEELKQILADYPPDIVQVPDDHKHYAQKPIGYGSVYEPGNSMDEWGVIWKNIYRGVVGEVKEPIVSPDDEDWEDISRIHFPEELLTLDTGAVKRFLCIHRSICALQRPCPSIREDAVFAWYRSLILRPDYAQQRHDAYS